MPYQVKHHFLKKKNGLDLSKFELHDASAIAAGRARRTLGAKMIPYIVVL